MKFALAGGQRVEAFAEGRGICPFCNGEVIAKCGTHRIAHWAHRGTRECDNWVENETEWHRAWKNNFPVDCQEFIQHDARSGEKHIADVRTPHGLVIEFQHSHLDPLERVARECFYGNMVWVVDGSRLKRDYPRFNKGMYDLSHPIIPGYFLLSFPEECFPPMWLDSSVPVIFDFRGMDESRPPDAFRDGLWCLLPGRVESSAVIVGMSREKFVEVAPSRSQLLDVQDILTVLREQSAANAREARPFVGIPSGRRPPRRYKRF